MSTRTPPRLVNSSMKVHPHSCRVILLLLLCSAFAATGQTAPAFQEEVGYLDVRRDHVEWPSPESVAAQLRSRDDTVRLNALHLIGLTEKQAHHPVWAQTSANKVIGEKVVTPDQIQLTYAALGDDTTEQAIIALLDSDGQMTYAAVGVPTSKGWERIAAFDCWCKYEMYSGRDTLDQFVQLVPAPGSPLSPRYELALRASGGGTGIYTQNEAHFRLFHHSLRRVLSFVSDHRSCDPTTNECTVERRWFYPTAVESGVGGVLVESSGRYSLKRTAAAEAPVRALENRFLGAATCRVLKWNERTFEYQPSSAVEACERLHP
jgi:hypothetical protein